MIRTALSSTPKAIIDKLHTDMVKVMNTPEVRERFAAVGADTIANTLRNTALSSRPS